ncbi:M16 family metallopeptidase [Streptomyces toxytricini]|uniref:M16 family metallopeptidase n=1 Tax=Streptomyces toxytricini TaxID=67369 RepID=A0ABW8EH90_STRT5
MTLGAPALDHRTVAEADGRHGPGVLAVHHGEVPLVEVSFHTPLRTDLTVSPGLAHALTALLATVFPTAGHPNGTGAHEEEHSLELLAAHRGAQVDVAGYGTGLLWNFSLPVDDWQGFLLRAADLLAARTPASVVASAREMVAAETELTLLDHDRLASAQVRALLDGTTHAAPAPPGHTDSSAAREAEQLLADRTPLGCLALGTACFTAVGGFDTEELGSGLGAFVHSLRQSGETARVPAPDPLHAPDAEPEPGPNSQATRHSTLFAGGGDTARLRMAWPAPRRDDPDYPAFFVAQHALGGGYRSRLMRRFRNELGWSYSPWSVVRHEPGRSFLEVDVEVPVRHLEAAKETLRATVAELSQLPPQADELRRVIGTALGTAAAAMAPQRGLAASLTHIRSLGLDTAWLWDWPRALDGVRPSDVIDVARRRLPLEDCVSVTVLPTGASAPSNPSHAPEASA